MLEQVAHWNDLSPKLKEKLEKRVDALGRKATFRFHVSHENPDPEKYNGKIVWPGKFTLSPATYKITDKDEDRKDKTKLKSIGLVKSVDEKGLPQTYEKVSILSRDEGRLNLDLEKEEDRTKCAFLLMHPALKEGMFADKDKQKVFELVDLKREASDNKAKRDAEFEAWGAAKKMTEAEIMNFASAMVWDETEDIDILRDKVEAEAKEHPELFIDLVQSKALGYRSTIKRALDSGVITVDPSTGTFRYAAGNTTIAVLGQSVDGRTEVERLAEYLLTGGKNADEVYKKIQSLLK
jgi:hypothetical protein